MPSKDNEQKHKAYLLSFEQLFLQDCERELKKINDFYGEKLAEASRLYDKMMLRVRNFMQQNHSIQTSRIDLRHKLPKQTIKQLKFAFSELYLSLVLLQNYQSLNYTGFRKILKKYDKLFDTKNGSKWFENNVEKAAFYTNHDIQRLINESENIFTEHLEGGDRARAMKRLRVPPLVETQMPWTTFRGGLLLGIFISLCIVSFFILNSGERQYYCAQYFYFYRGPILLIFLIFLISLNIMGWRKFGINHILIFEIDPRNHLHATDLMEMAFFLAVFWILSFLGLCYYKHLCAPPLVFPMILLVFMLVYLLNPLPIFHRSSRWWLTKLLGRVITAPFHKVGFADFWLADQLNSLVVGLGDFEFILYCYFYNFDWNNERICEKYDVPNLIFKPIVSCLPAWFRFAQCLRRFYDTGKGYPFLINAGKYATTFPVVLFSTLMIVHSDSYSNNVSNPYVWAYLISNTLSSFYCFAWDILRDFGVFKNFSGEHIFLRDHIVYPPAFYYYAIVQNFVLRFYWIFVFYCIQEQIIEDFTVSTSAAVFEVWRRFFWNYLRLEHEHLYNEGQFRAVRDIHVPILDPNDESKLQEMTDILHGVRSRNNQA